MIGFLAALPHSDPLSARERDGYTPLHIAAERGHLFAVRVLVGLNADQHAEEKTGHSPYEVCLLPFSNQSFSFLLLLNSVWLSGNC